MDYGGAGSSAIHCCMVLSDTAYYGEEGTHVLADRLVWSVAWAVQWSGLGGRWTWWILWMTWPA
jgi:hypothetical protein